MMNGRKVNEIANFGEVLCFRLIEENEWTYPSILMRGAQGTSAELFGQSMTPAEIEALGLALIKFANGAAASKSWLQSSAM